MRKIGEILQDVRKKAFPGYNMDEREQKVYETLDKICKLETTEFKVAPLKEEFYILNEGLHIRIKVSRREVKFVNGTYFYSYQFPLSFQEKLLDLVGNHIQEDRDKFEQEMFMGELELLKKLEERVNRATE